MRRTKLTLGLLSLVWACGPEGEMPATFDENVSDLIVDTDMDGNTGDGVIWHQQWPAAQRMYRGCTGTYLKRPSDDHPPVVLTAVHCGPSYDLFGQEGGEGFAYYRDTASSPGPVITSNLITNFEMFHVREVIDHPSYDGGVHNDVSLVVLREIPRDQNGDEIVGMNLYDGLPPTGWYTAVGAGCTTVGQQKTRDGQRRAGDTHVSSVDPAGDIHRAGAVHDGTNQIGGASGCSGDSGGPLIGYKNGENQVLGVMSRASWDVNTPQGGHSTRWAPVFNHTNNNNYSWIQNNLRGTCGTAKFDDNDYYGNAEFADLEKRVELDKSKTIRAGINCSMDEDYYRLDVIAGQRIKFDVLFEHSDGDLDVELHRVLPVSGNATEVYAGVVVASGRSITDNEFIDHVATQAGEYYIRVFGYSGAIADYRIVTCGTQVSNSSMSTAQLLVDGVTVSGNVCAGQEAWYSMDTNEGIAPEILVSFLHANGDVDIDVIKQDGTHFGPSGYSETDNEFISQTLWGTSVPTARYFLKVKTHNNEANTFDVLLSKSVLQVSNRTFTNPDAQGDVRIDFSSSHPSKTRCYGPLHSIYQACPFPCTQAFDKLEKTALTTQHSCVIRLDTDGALRFKVGAFLNGAETVPDWSEYGPVPPWEVMYFLP